jgi:arsenite-transporting ATPase
MRQQEALKKIPIGLKQIINYSLPYVSYSLTGVHNLRYLFKTFSIPAVENKNIVLADEKLLSTKALVDDFAGNNTRIILTMGKGGVGKTTVASIIAVGLVEKGHKVHLTTTDPAAHLELLFANGEMTKDLRISRIDPAHEVELYKKEVLAKAKENLDEDGLAYLEEDLNSPCTEEIAVFRAFAEVVEKSKDEIVVIDTAPTGHTLLLLDAARSYHNEIARSTGEVPESVQQLLPRLRNPKETSVVIVTLPEATPVLEAKRLQEDLIRAEINPKWWVVNQSLYGAHTKDPVLKGKSFAEKSWINHVYENLTNHCVIIPWQTEEKIGFKSLKEFIEV